MSPYKRGNIWWVWTRWKHWPHLKLSTDTRRKQRAKAMQAMLWDLRRSDHGRTYIQLLADYKLTLPQLYDAYHAGRMSRRELELLFSRSFDKPAAALETYLRLVRKTRASPVYS